MMAMHLLYLLLYDTVLCHIVLYMLQLAELGQDSRFKIQHFKIHASRPCKQTMACLGV